MTRARSRAAAALLGSVLLLPACRFGDASLPEPEEVQIPVAQAERGPFVVVAQEVGVLVASKSVRLRAPFWGRIAELTPEGTQVEAGDQLLKMDVEEIERRVVRRRQDVRASEGELGQKLERMTLQAKSTALDEEALTAQAKHDDANLAQAQREADDAARQAELGLIRVTESENRQRTLEAAVLQHEQKDASTGFKREELRSKTRKLEVERKEASRKFERSKMWLEAQERQVERAVIRAPAPGRVFYPNVRPRGAQEPRKVRVGDHVSEWTGSIVELPDTDSLIVESQIDEALYERVKAGTPAEIRLAALDDLVLPAQVASVGFLAIPRSEAAGAGFRERRENEAEEQVVFPVTVQPERLEPRVQAGMSVAVTFLLDSFEDVVTVPSGAVFGSPEDPFVFVKQPGGHRIQPVSLGPSSQGEVVVLEGLEGGETLLLGDPRGVS